MNKIFTKIATACAGLAMAIGVGVAIGNNANVAPAKAADGNTKYALINSASSLEAGKSYIITSFATGSGYAMAVTENTNNRPAVAASETDGKITRGSGIMSFTLSGTTGAWKLTADNYAGSNSGFSQGNQTGKNYLKMAATSDNWTIAFSGNAATITSTLQTTRNVIRYNANNGSPIFSCYTSGQSDVYLWKEVASGDTLNSVNIATTSGSSTVATSGNVEQNKTLTLYATANYQNAGATNVTNDATWTSSNETAATVNKGVVTGRALTNGTPVTITASFGGKSATYSLEVVPGPTLTLGVHSINMLTLATREDITITTENWSGTPTITASSNNTNALQASINASGKLKLVTQALEEDADVTVTVTATLNARVETDSIDIKVKAPVLTFVDSISMKPSQEPAVYTAVTANFANDVELEANGYDNTVISVTIDGMNVTVSPLKIGTTSISLSASDGDSRTVLKAIDVTIANVDTYTLVTDAANLVDGGQIIISNVDTTKAMSTTQNSNNRGIANTSALNNVISNPGSDVQIIELEASGSNFYLKVGEKYLFAPTGNSNNLRSADNKDSAHAWTITVSNGKATIKSTTLDKYIRYNGSSSIFSCYSSATNQGDIRIYLKDEAPVSVEDVALTGTVSATTGDTKWNTSSLVFSVKYEGDENFTVIDNQKVTFAVSEDVPTITENGTTKVHVTASLKSDSTVRIENVELTANLTFANVYSIENLYTKTVGTTITVYGQIIGLYGNPTDGIFVANGNYAALVYKYAGEDTNTFVPYTTFVKVTGVISEYRGLREIGSTSSAPSIQVVTEEEAAPFFEAVTDYSFDGSEDAVANKNLASRPALVEGTVTAVSGNFSSSSNTTVTMQLTSGNTVNVFLKSGQSIDYEGLSAACKVDAEIKLKVFVSIFANSNNGDPYFQLVNPTLIHVSETYTAVDFAKDLLKDTGDVCSISNDGNGEALVSVWRVLKNDKFSTLKEAQVEILVNASANYSDANITAQTTDEQIISYAMGRYNLIAKKYAKVLGDMANFIGRTDVNEAPVTPLEAANSLFDVETSSSTAIINIVVMSVLATICAGGFFFYRRRKEQQ